MTRFKIRINLTFSGYFAYIDPDPPRVFGDAAIIYNPDFVATPTGQCLGFWYHMHTPGVGSLSVNMYDPLTNTIGDALWTKSGDQGDMWRYVTVTLQDPITSWAVSYHIICFFLKCVDNCDPTQVNEADVVY